MYARYVGFAVVIPSGFVVCCQTCSSSQFEIYSGQAGKSRGTPEKTISALLEHILGKFHSLCNTGTKGEMGNEVKRLKHVPNFDTNVAGNNGQRRE